MNWSPDCMTEPTETLATVSTKVGVKVAVTDLVASIVTLQAPVPVHAPLQPARLSFEADGARVELAHGEDGVSPGQACVFYAAEDGGERLLGGGWIKSATSSAWVAEDAYKAPASSSAESAFAAGSR